MLVAKDVLACKDAIAAMVVDSKWAAASASSVNAAALRETVLDTSFWPALEAVVQLLQPVMDAIHQLEADQPLLSQV